MPKKKQAQTATQLDILQRLHAKLKEQMNRLPKPEDHPPSGLCPECAWGAAKQGCTYLEALLDALLASRFSIDDDRLQADPAGAGFLEGLRMAFLSEDSLRDWIGWTETTIRKLKLAPALEEARSAKQERGVRQLKAMLLVKNHPEWSDAKVAEKVGLAPSTLSRDKLYQKVAATQRGQKEHLPKGFRDPKTGNLEAYK